MPHPRAQLLHAFAVDSLLCVRRRDHRRDGRDNVGVERDPDDHREDAEDALLVRLGRDVAVPDGRHRREGPVQRYEVLAAPVPVRRVHVVARVRLVPAVARRRHGARQQVRAEERQHEQEQDAPARKTNIASTPRTIVGN